MIIIIICCDKILWIDSIYIQNTFHLTNVLFIANLIIKCMKLHYSKLKVYLIIFIDFDTINLGENTPAILYFSCNSGSHFVKKICIKLRLAKFFPKIRNIKTHFFKGYLKTLVKIIYLDIETSIEISIELIKRL